MEIKKILSPYLSPDVHIEDFFIESTVICASEDDSPITPENPFEDSEETDW